MSYEDKYLKYKNKYLALKSKLANNGLESNKIKILNMLGGADDASPNAKVEANVEVPKVEESNVEAPNVEAPKVEEVKVEEAKEPETVTETTVSKPEETDVEKKFQSGGAKSKSKSKSKSKEKSSYKKHFFQNDSEITDKSSESSMSDFSSSELDW